MCSPQSVCFDLPGIPACDLSTCPTQSHVHFLWGQRRVPKSRCLRDSTAAPRPRYTELPQRLMSWRLQHQRGCGSGGWVRPSLTLPWPLHHNVWVRSHSLTFTFLMICVYQWPSSTLCFPSCCHPTPSITVLDPSFRLKVYTPISGFRDSSGCSSSQHWIIVYFIFFRVYGHKLWC